MKLPIHIKTVKRLRETLDTDRRNGLSIGFVPTMGFLHDGHASLMRRATADCDRVVASIFVNPLQFAANEDLEDYPRDLQRDTEVAGNAGVDYLFIPSVEEMYPDWPVKTEVRVPELAAHWDGASRPTHFTGVATVVSKLFNMVGPCNAYFGRKDFQQLVIIRRMVKDLSFPILVTGCPTIREQDGLAMSSRNTYLSAEDRAAAVVLNQALQAGKHAALNGENNPAKITRLVESMIRRESRGTLDYVATVDRETLSVPDQLGAESLILVACWFGKTRLIDNMLVRDDG